jgi:hypothetical protein
VKLHDFMTNQDLVGDEFLADSWSTWRCVARLIDGDAHLLSEEDQELALQLTGRTELPTSAPDEVVAGPSRGSGKSRFCGIIGAWKWAEEYTLAPGQVAVVALAAPDRDQAALLFDYVYAILNGSELLKEQIQSETATTIESKHGTKIEVITSNFRSVRGRTMAAVVVDECAFLRSDNSALPDIELYRALTPALIKLYTTHGARGMFIAISSPHMRRGLMYELYGKYFANNQATGLYLEGESLTFNPLLDRGMIDKAIADDPEAAQSEWLGKFRSDLSSFLPLEDIDRAIIKNRRSLPLSYQYFHKAFCDPSGGRSDAMTLGVAHAEGVRLVLDKLITVIPPFDPEATVIRFAEILSSYGLNQVVGDRYGGEWVVAAFARHGVNYTPSELTASEIYCEAAPLFSEGLIELLDIPSLRVELSLLERRPRAGSRGDTVDHPRNSHDDQAIAAIGSLLLASKSLNASNRGYASDITHAICEVDHGYRERRRLPPPPLGLGGNFGQELEDYSSALTDYDPNN